MNEEAEERTPSVAAKEPSETEKKTGDKPALPPSLSLTERLKRIDPTFARRYQQKQGQ